VVCDDALELSNVRNLVAISVKSVKPLKIIYLSGEKELLKFNGKVSVRALRRIVEREKGNYGFDFVDSKERIIENDVILKDISGDTLKCVEQKVKILSQSGLGKDYFEMKFDIDSKEYIARVLKGATIKDACELIAKEFMTTTDKVTILFLGRIQPHTMMISKLPLKEDSRFGVYIQMDRQFLLQSFRGLD
jgi:hypothetical protein